jgi:hypothetical protein
VDTKGFDITWSRDSMILTCCKIYKILANRGNIGADELSKKGFNATTIDGG